MEKLKEISLNFIVFFSSFPVSNKSCDSYTVNGVNIWAAKILPENHFSQCVKFTNFPFYLTQRTTYLPPDFDFDTAFIIYQVFIYIMIMNSCYI